MILAVRGVIWGWTSATQARLLAEARMSLEAGDFERSEALGLRLARGSMAPDEGWLIAGDSAARQGRYEEALAHYRQVRESAAPIYVTALVSSGDAIYAQRKLWPAELAYREALLADPENLPAHERLALLLSQEGRDSEARIHLLELLRRDHLLPQHLIRLAISERVAGDPLLAEFSRVESDDPGVLCGLAREALRENRDSEASVLLGRLIRRAPELWLAQAWQGALLAASGAEAEFVDWHANLPAAADDCPEIWRQRGEWAERQDEQQVAVRCYFEAARLDANSQAAHYRLGQLLHAAGDAQRAQPFLERARLLEELVVSVRGYQLTKDRAYAATSARLCEELGRFWEARGWVQLQSEPLAPQDAAGMQMERLRELAFEEPAALVPARVQPARNIDLSSYPLPRWHGTRNHEGPARGDAAEFSEHRGIAFRDLAASAGCEFTYFAGRPNGKGAYRYEHGGGGVAVLDYDADGLPDLHFTQGCAWPPNHQAGEHLDRLFRNRSGRGFVDVTLAARLIEDGFSQGVTVGDYDNDGFDDLYVCNIGGNRLFHNNGDGTFSDVTDFSHTAGNDWSTSCAMADLNGDGWPDLYVVNYLAGEGLFDGACRRADGAIGLCTPHEFRGALDTYFLNLGDGRFEGFGHEAQLELPNGKGLGVLVGDFDCSGRLGVFVANDATPNFFFSPKRGAAGSPLKFEEVALLRGLAVDADGRSQACMGIAVGDADGDGRPDFFVTNFRDESNTLYLQTSAGQFLDRTRFTGLREPGFPMVGFGTQFLDANLDGRLDLVVTNGHVGDLRERGLPYQMRPQFFANLGEGKFVELRDRALGEFFAGEFVGRALARLDWNADGLDDFVVSHLGSPAALVTNQTRSAGHFLALRLCGVRSSRDAIGAAVSLTAQGKTWRSLLCAGDGYQSRNERLLRFGVGDCEEIDRLEIRWPSGTVQVLESLPIDETLLIIEDRPDVFRWPSRD